MDGKTIPGRENKKTEREPRNVKLPHPATAKNHVKNRMHAGHQRSSNNCTPRNKNEIQKKSRHSTVPKKKEKKRKVGKTQMMHWKKGKIPWKQKRGSAPKQKSNI